MPILFSTGGYFSGRKAAEALAWQFFYLVPNFIACGATTSLRAEGHATFTPHFDLCLLHHVHNTTDDRALGWSAMVSGLYHARARFDRGRSTDYTEASDYVFVWI